jgi:hypothetical protein
MRYLLILSIFISQNILGQNMTITKHNKAEIDNLLKIKESFIDIDSNKLYDDRYTIAIKEQLFYTLNNGVIDEEYIIDIFNKVSDVQRRKSFINQLFFKDDENFNKHSKINKTLLEYIDNNSTSFDFGYALILKSKLLKDPKITESIYKYLINNKFETLRHNSELLTEICFTYEIDKLIELITDLTVNTDINLIPYSNKHPFSVLFNRTFNTVNERKIIDLSFNYLLHRKVNSDWFYVFNLVNNYRNNPLYNSLITTKQKDLENEMSERLHEKLNLTFIDSETKRKLIEKKSVKSTINYYEIFKQETLQKFNQELSENLKVEIHFGDGEIGRDPNYSEVISEYFLPISEGDLSKFMFLSKLKYTDDEKRDAQIIVYALKNDLGFSFRPKFIFDWVQTDDLIKFLNYILKSEGINKKFVYNTYNGRIAYKSAQK